MRYLRFSEYVFKLRKCVIKVPSSGTIALSLLAKLYGILFLDVSDERMYIKDTIGIIDQIFQTNIRLKKANTIEKYK